MAAPEGRKASVKDKDELRMYVETQEEFDEWRQAFKASTNVVGPGRKSIASPRGSVGGATNATYDRLLSFLERAKDITTGIAHKIEWIGTEKDTEAMRKDMYRERVEMQQGKRGDLVHGGDLMHGFSLGLSLGLVLSCAGLLKAEGVLVQMETDSAITPEQHARLTSTIEGLKQTLAEVTERAQVRLSSTSVHKAQAAPPAFDEGAAEEERGQDTGIAGLQEVTNEDEFAANEALMAERAQEITKIAKDVVTVRELFADVADLVKEQG
jgi:hypothetical protein